MGYLGPRGSCTGPWYPRVGSADNFSILDVDECVVTDQCLGGQCVNTEGSFNCLCKTGFQPSPESGECVGKGSRGSGQGFTPGLPTSTHAWPLVPWDQDCSFWEAEHFPQINHLMGKAFIETAGSGTVRG